MSGHNRRCHPQLYHALRAELLVLASLALTLPVTAEPAACPVRNCPVALGRPPNATATFDVKFKPGHFVCRKCDVRACETCALLCDLEQCTGEFYKQECWCEDRRNVLRSETHKVYCDRDCSGGICDQPGMRCRRRADACKPWWWCGEPPPKWGSEFLQRSSSLHQRSAHGLDFRLARFDCASAALPPKVWDEEALMWVNKGYLILDQRACDGDVFDTECFCWDNFKYLSGKDPLTSQLKCDRRCRWGPCDGKTCGKRPPAALPPPTVGPKGPDDASTRNGHIVMEPVDEAVLTGTGL